ncbi:MAG: hypothetical protein QOJ90_1180 [Actinomycetota bacterium]|jgi:2'-hydroxyisoflavone reductase|nr:hypothetical protein [Actinomycetota bacterium]MDQ1641829.1 hypothetical protein [Actinomycetota bacterium]
MDVLVLGGGSFVGRWIVEDLLERGHTLTLFSRGKTGVGLFDGVERLIGDRETGDYEALAGHVWDAVVDVSGYVPRHVEQAIQALHETPGRYVFISTGLVYDRALAPEPITETSPRLAPEWQSEEIDDDTYGPLKVACEDVLAARLGTRGTVVRPGWVVGPYELAERLTYWVRRAAGAGPVAVPLRLDRPVQVVDVRDVARLVTHLLERNLPGAFNAVGPTPAVTLAQLIRACGDAELIPVEGGELDFPLTLPDESWDVMFRISAAAAHAAGMPRTSLSSTIAATRAWDLERGEPPLKSGLSDEHESELLAAALPR